MPGSFFPGVLPFSAMDGGTVALDGESLTAAGETIRSPWINAGTLARVRWELASGTFTDVQMRSSVSAPESRADQCPIQPAAADWTHQYAPSIGSLPTSQGWASSGTPSGSVAGGVLTMTAAGSGYYIINPAGWTPASVDQIVWRCGLRVNTGHVGRFDIYLDDGTNRHAIGFTGSAYAGNARKIAAGGVYVPGYQYSYDTWMDMVCVARYNGSTTPTDARLYLRDRGSGTTTDLTGLVDRGLTGYIAGAFNTLIFGNVANTGAINVDVDFVGGWQGSEWETVTDGDTSFTALDRGYVQLKGTLDGTLTKLDISNDLTAPSDLTVSATPASSGVIYALASAPTSGNVLYWERTGPSTSATEYASDERAYAWSDCEDGSHTISVRQATPDGVLSANAAEATATLPATTPTAPTKPTTPAYDGGTLYFYRGAAGMYSLANNVIQSSTDGQTWTTAATVADSSVTWTSGRAPASAFGITPGATTWYRNYVTDAQNLQSLPSDEVYGGDPNSRECVVSFDFGAELASQQVAYYYSHPMTVRGGSYAKASGRVTLDGSGVGSVSLPRTAVATCADGDTGRPFVTFIAPGYSSEPMPRVIPDASAATFASLSAPGT